MFYRRYLLILNGRAYVRLDPDKSCEFAVEGSHEFKVAGEKSVFKLNGLVFLDENRIPVAAGFYYSDFLLGKVPRLFKS